MRLPSLPHSKFSPGPTTRQYPAIPGNTRTKVQFLAAYCRLAVRLLPRNQFSCRIKSPSRTIRKDRQAMAEAYALHTSLVRSSSFSLVCPEPGASPEGPSRPAPFSNAQFFIFSNCLFRPDLINQAVLLFPSSPAPTALGAEALAKAAHRTPTISHTAPPFHKQIFAFAISSFDRHLMRAIFAGHTCFPVFSTPMRTTENSPAL
jgi:hypothetical protein